jgi:Protein of unknown function (DUF2630)
MTVVPYRAWRPSHRIPLVAEFDPYPETARERAEELSPIPREFDVYAHIEGLVGEETELLEGAEESRKEEHRKRLRTIGEELDRAWEALRGRAERRARPGS